MDVSDIEAGLADPNESVWQKIRADIRHYAAREGARPSLKLTLRLFFVTAGFQFVFARRIQEMLQAIPLIGRPLKRVWWWWCCLFFSSEIAIAARVAGGLYIPHPYGIVVGAATIGPNVTILQNVTIGRRSRADTADPDIRAGVIIGAGAVVLGRITLGEGANVGANSVVLKDVPAGATAIGIPAKVLVSQAAAVDPILPA